jgi:hypothetical protein
MRRIPMHTGVPLGTVPNLRLGTVPESPHDLPYLVTPAKAGVHHPTGEFLPPVMDSRIRGNDEFG